MGDDGDVRSLEESLRIAADLERLADKGLFRTAFQTSPDSINLNRLDDGVYVDVNEGFSALTGWTRGEILGRSSREIGIWADPEERNRLVEGLRRDGEVRNLEARFRLKDGRIRTGLMSARIFRLEGVPYVLSVTRDIEDWKSAQAGYETFRTLVENSNDFISMADAEARIVYLNPAGARLAGLDDPAAARGMTISDFTDPESDTGGVARNLPILKERGWVVGEERLRNLRTGALVDVEYSAFLLPPQYAGNGAAVGVVARDVSDRKRAEAERARLEERLHETHRLESIGRLAGGVAHDFNNLLTPILGFTELLLADLPDGHPMRATLEQVRSAGVRGKDITGQLLAFGRRQMLRMKVADVGALVAGVRPMLHRLVREEFHLRFDPDPRPLHVYADASQFDLVLVNLAMNAQDALSAGGTVTIGTRCLELGDDATDGPPGLPPGRWAVVWVRDDGHGMDAETLAHVFEPFFTTKRSGHGTGLGLATTYGVVRQHGGHIVAESSPGAGSTFRIFLPLVDPPDVAAEIPEPEVSATQGRETILLVEDEPSVRRLARDILESHGYAVIEAPDAETAFARYGSWCGRIDLLLSDVVLPGENGLQLHRRLSAGCPGLRAVFMSGYTDDVVARHGVLAPGVTLVQKPFTVRELTHCIREVLDRKG
jgi:PAS domain S-box-containing protein